MGLTLAEQTFERDDACECKAFSLTPTLSRWERIHGPPTAVISTPEPEWEGAGLGSGLRAGRDATVRPPARKPKPNLALPLHRFMEREKVRQRSKCCSVPVGRTRSACLPLPAGEGRGEGEGIEMQTDVLVTADWAGKFAWQTRRQWLLEVSWTNFSRATPSPRPSPPMGAREKRPSSARPFHLNAETRRALRGAEGKAN